MLTIIPMSTDYCYYKESWKTGSKFSW